MAKKSTEISEAKIRQALWMLKKNKTKKVVCEHLGIAYNPKRLQTILDNFQVKIVREKELKRKARFKEFTNKEKEEIVKDYLEGGGITPIGALYYVSPQRIKKILIEMNVPLRGRGKKSAANVEHVVQDLDVRFKIGDKVFLPKTSQFAYVHEIFDEEWLEIYRHPIRRRYVELSPMKNAKKKYGESYEGKEDIHWNIYWEYENGSQWKEQAIKYRINQIESILEETGRETYRLYISGDNGHWVQQHRDNLYPVVTNGN